MFVCQRKLTDVSKREAITSSHVSKKRHHYNHIIYVSTREAITSSRVSKKRHHYNHIIYVSTREAITSSCLDEEASSQSHHIRLQEGGDSNTTSTRLGKRGDNINTNMSRRRGITTNTSCLEGGTSPKTHQHVSKREAITRCLY